MKDDTPLSRLLQEWQSSLKPHPRFSDGVWDRIAAQSVPLRRRTPAGLGRWFLFSLSKPVYACAFVLASALTGVAVAEMHAGSVTQHRNAELQQQYLTSIDPVARADNALHSQP